MKIWVRSSFAKSLPRLRTSLATARRLRPFSRNQFTAKVCATLLPVRTRPRCNAASKGVEAIVEELKKLSKKVSDRSEIAQVATVSANWDKTIGEIIADAMDKVGKDGTITVEEAKSIETTLEVVEGMQFDKGYLSPYFVTNAEAMEAAP